MPLFVIVRPIRKKLQLTVSFDHPVTADERREWGLDIMWTVPWIQTFFNCRCTCQDWVCMFVFEQSNLIWSEQMSQFKFSQFVNMSRCRSEKQQIYTYLIFVVGTTGSTCGENLSWRNNSDAYALQMWKIWNFSTSVMFVISPQCTLYVVLS